MPIIKCAQNGLDVNSFQFMVFLGAILPILLLGILVGVYAVLVEKSEHNIKKLFRLCVSLPALLMSISAGKPSSVAVASEMQIEVFCAPTSQFVQGVQAVYSSLTNQTKYNYLVLSDQETSNEFIMVSDKRYYVLRKTVSMPRVEPQYTVYNMNKCKEESNDNS